MTKDASCSEKFGDVVEGTIGGGYSKLGNFVGARPRLTILLSLAIALVFGFGFTQFTQESRPEELWVPQGTQAEKETEQFESYFPTTSRFNQIIVQAANVGDSVLTREALEDAMKMHMEIETRAATVKDEEYTLTDICTKTGGTCVDESAGKVCKCFITSILRQWNYNLETLKNDTDLMKTLQEYGTREDLEAVLGKSVWSDDNELLSAEAFSLSYFLQDMAEVVDGNEEDPVNEGWEEQVFLDVASSKSFSRLSLVYFASRSFSDEFGDAISGDTLLVMVSIILVFLFIGATMGNFRCRTGSRWTMALAAQVMVGLAVVAGFGLSSIFGLKFSPVHNLLPFVLLGLGVDDAFVIVNAFNRERTVPRSHETNKDLADRAKRSLVRAGSSILVTSLTDIVAFAISASSGLPALASFGAFAAICIFFLWWFASTFFSACLVYDERRQRDNGRELLCCLTREKEVEDEPNQEGRMPKLLRNYYAPYLLSKVGKVMTILCFSGLLSFGIYGATQLSVEDTQREFIPDGSYVLDYFDAADTYFADEGLDLYVTFEESSNIYANRESLSELNSRLTGLSTAPPYISEPVSEEAYRNVMDGFSQYLETNGTDAIGGAELGEDGWPTSEADFVSTLKLYASIIGPGSKYVQDVSFSEDGTALDAFRVKLEYIKLVKVNDGKVSGDANKQIDAMDATREMVASWSEQPVFPYSERFINIEGYKVIQEELFLNVGLALACVTVIVFCTVANLVSSLLIALNVAMCVTEILGFMWVMGIVIDSVSVINLVLTVGLSVDYSAHIGHCFMTKGGSDRNKRVTESLADIGSAVLQGAISTFLAVVVLLFSSSYVFEVLSRQFALTVILGVLHGLVLLPVMLSTIGPKAYSTAKSLDDEDDDSIEKPGQENDELGVTAHKDALDSSSSDNDSAPAEGTVDAAVAVEPQEDELEA